MKIKVWRSGRGGSGSRYDTFEIGSTPGMSVLEALFEVQDLFDDSLAFRYSCRGAVCGSCAMSINREPRLACRTRVADAARMKDLNLRQFPGLEKKEAWNRDAEILVEPLPNMPILKDLTVDMTRFYDAHKKMRPWLDSDQNSKGFSTMFPEDVMKLDKFANCILCAACFGACPVCERNQSYVGPAALAWSYRFYDDPREANRQEKLDVAGQDDGVPDCEFIYNCVKVCPKNVAPALAIRKLKDRIEG